MKDLGERIRTMRASRNLTQADLASALNVSRSAVAMWESGDREPSLEMIEGLADTFNVSISSLVDRNPGSMYAPYPNILPIHRKRVRLLGEIAAGVPILADALTALGELPPDARSRVVALILDMRSIARQRGSMEPVEPPEYDMDVARDVALSKIQK